MGKQTICRLKVKWRLGMLSPLIDLPEAECGIIQLNLR